MEHTRFDAVTRRLGTRLPRRGLLGLLAALTVAGVTGVPEEGAAKHKHRKKCPTGQKKCSPGKGQPCVGCCSDTDCGGNACVDGTCADCPRGQRVCRGGCIAADGCCADAECIGGRVCAEGRCDCRASERLCQGTCIPRDACCGNVCPPPTTCTPSNCGGCCDGITCRPGNTPTFCGLAGVTCTPCQDGETCRAGACVCATECCRDADCTESDACRCLSNGTCSCPL